MRKVVIFLSFSLLASVRMMAQNQPVGDSTHRNKLDSTQVNWSSKFHQTLNLNTKGSHAMDTISPGLAHYKHSLDSVKRGLTHQMDSLKRLNLPTGKYKHKLDSLNRIDPLKVVQQQEAKLRTEEQKVTGAVTGIEKKVNQELNSLTREAAGGASIPNANLPNANIPGANIPGANLNPNLGNSLSLPNNSIPQLSNPINGNLNGMGNIQKDMNLGTNLPQKELSELKNIGDVNSAEKDIGEAGKLTQKATGYEKQIAGVAKGDSASMAKLSKTLENDAKNVSGVKDLQKETGMVDNYKKLASSADNPDALKKEAMEQAQKQAINHFAGEEQVLQGAMNQMSKIKQKYSNVTSLSNLPKRPPNPMKGKPLIERIIPGITFAVLKVNKQTLIDFNPWIGYHFTGRITAGGGWNERIEISHFHFSNQRVYGPRVYGEYKLGRGFTSRFEIETMNTYIPPNQIPPGRDPSSREWLWNSFAGLKREYKLFKYLKGNIQMLYNITSLYGHHRLNLYGDPLTVRMGFEFPMKKEVKDK